MRPEPNRDAAEALIGELGCSGVREACISPGSRSTPVVLALARSAAIRAWVATDERSAGFFALGMARETGRPVALVCTSGTAAANYLPAVVEASQANVPLVVITADRPTELRDCGAAQTIDQVRLFGSHARWSIDLPEPAADVALADYFRSIACRAVATAVEEKGPVHLNLPLREPLLDVASEQAAPASKPTARFPRVTVHTSNLHPSPHSVTALGDRLASCERGVFVCGPGTGGRAAAPAVARLAAGLRWPILADPLSGLRFGPHDRSLVIDAYDVLLRDPDFCAAHRPEAVVQLGRLPASKALERFLAAGPSAVHLLVAPAGWPDPLHRATDVVRGEPGMVCALLAEGVGEPGKRSAWSESWIDSSGAVRDALDELLRSDASFFEGTIFSVLHRLLPEGAALHVGNSMPVRDADTFLSSAEQPLDVHANRGASGIDGVVSTALGAAAVRRAPTVLVVGDLSFLHDLGALQIAARHRIPLLVILVLNDGGGIFSFLPQAALGETFETFFATPHGLDPEGAIAMCGGRYTRAGSRRELAAAVERGLRSGGLEVVAVRVNRAENVARHREIVAAALDHRRAVAGRR